MKPGPVAHRIRTSMGQRPDLPSHIGRLDGLHACERPFCPFRHALAGHSCGLGLGRFPRGLSMQLRRTCEWSTCIQLEKKKPEGPNFLTSLFYPKYCLSVQPVCVYMKSGSGGLPG